MRIAGFRRVVEPTPERGHDQRAVGRKRAERLLDHRRVDQRLIALHVDNEIAIEGARDFGEAIGAGLVRWTRHADPATKRPHGGSHTLIVCGDHDVAQRAARGCAAIHVLDERLARKVGEKLSGESG